MMTWKLWRALMNPPRAHPVYRHAGTYMLAAPRRFMAGGWVVFAYLALCCGASFLWPMAAHWFPPLIGVVVLLGNTIYSLTWAVHFGGVIAKEREGNTYDLLCISPPGPLVISWALCTARLYRTQLFTWVYFGVRFVTLVIIVTLSVALIIPILSLTHQTSLSIHLELFHILILALALATGFLIDHIQSLVMGSLAGVVAPVFSRHSSEARFRAMALFLGLQLAGYTLAGVVALGVVPAVFPLLNTGGWTGDAGLTITVLLAFLMIREGVIAGFWRYVTNQLNTSMAEFDLTSYQVN
jgi:hypothetical protein